MLQVMPSDIPYTSCLKILNLEHRKYSSTLQEKFLIYYHIPPGGWLQQMEQQQQQQQQQQKQKQL